MVETNKDVYGSDLKESDAESMASSLVYSESFVDSINAQADNAKWASDYINEIFMYFFLKIKENAVAMRKDRFEKINPNIFRSDWSVYVMAAKAAGLHVNNKVTIAYHALNVMYFIYSFIMVFVSSLVLPILVLVTRKKEDKEICSDISVVRAPASYSKMKFLEESGKVVFYFDDIFQRDSSGSSMYSHGNVFQRFFSLVIIPCVAIKDYFLIIQDSKNLLGWHCTGFVLAYYCKRVAHKSTFEYFLNLILQKNRQAVYYTGNKEDRFAVLEMRLCKKYGVRVVCIPHGIEYAFKVPAGLSGDVFYCTTQHAQEHLSRLYRNENKFLYDKNVAERMFSRHQPITEIEQIVFFPESREPEKNLLIIKKLVESEIPIYVKLHIKDSPENYKEYSDRFVYVDDFDVSISNKVCLARKSTVLIEAIYNNSIAIAVLIDSKDRAYVDYMFPSLKDPQINRVYTLDELLKLLDRCKYNFK